MKILRKLKCLNGAHLKIFAMCCMLLDHAWATVVPGNLWMNCVGRLAFPIFAFQVAEGYAHTSDFKKYLKRMFLFALVSELPYNLMTGGNWFHPFGQNVMFTFCLALLVIRFMDKARKKGPLAGVAAAVGGAVVGFLLGTVTFVDYYGYGILMVLAFWLFREIPWGWALQLAAMIFINYEMLGGLIYEVFLFGQPFMLSIQGLAVFALIPIWLYNGQPGSTGKKFRYACYAFYPVHMLILSLIGLCLL